MPIGINHIESVNVYIVEDGDSVTLVDCGMWHPGEPDDGLTIAASCAQRAGLRARRHLADLRHSCSYRPLRHGWAPDGAHRCRAAHARHDRPGLRKVSASRDRAGAEARHLQRPRSAAGRPTRFRRHTRRLDAVPALRRRSIHSPAGRRGRHHWQPAVGRSAHPGPFARPHLPVVADGPTAVLRRSPSARCDSPGHVRARIRQGSPAQLSRVSQAGRGARS